MVNLTKIIGIIESGFNQSFTHKRTVKKCNDINTISTGT